MDLATFVERSEGTWRSMRSGHSLAFQQFEEVLSQIKIERLPLLTRKLLSFLSPPLRILG